MNYLNLSTTGPVDLSLPLGISFIFLLHTLFLYQFFHFPMLEWMECHSLAFFSIRVNYFGDLFFKYHFLKYWWLENLCQQVESTLWTSNFKKWLVIQYFTCYHRQILAWPPIILSLLWVWFVAPQNNYHSNIKDHWSQSTITNIIIMKKFETLWELTKCDTETWSEQMLFEKWPW